MNLIYQLEKEQMATVEDRKAPGVGDTVKVHVRIQEGDKSRIQVYEGTVIAIHKGGPRTTFTVRKMSFGVGVERIFPLYSPFVTKIEVQGQFRVRRAKLYFLRELRGKKARLKELRNVQVAGVAARRRRRRR